MKTFEELRKINVGEYIERKGNLNYLSWSWALDQLLQNDPTATWEFPEPKEFGETMMVYCHVTAFGKTLKMHLPVMDNRNQAVKNPDTRKISDSMMRCLAKCIACFGIGLYIYAGEDLPDDATSNVDTNLLTKFVTDITLAPDLETLKSVYITACRTCSNDVSAMKSLEVAKDNRKTELSNQSHEAKGNQS